MTFLSLVGNYKISASVEQMQHEDQKHSHGNIQRMDTASSMPALFQCQICGEGISPEGMGVHRRVSGWTDAKRGAKQASVSLPIEMSQYAHEQCIKLAKLGVNSTQNSFF
jgi:hypothetical protein